MAIEKLTEEVVNEVATNFEEAAEVTRKINAAGVSYFIVGLGVGAAVGLYFGYKFNRKKIRAEAFEEADAEIEMIRAVYLDKMRGMDNDSTSLHGVVPTEKPPVDEVVRTLQYDVEVPSRERPLPAPVPIHDDPVESVETEEWNYEKELVHRSPDSPYVIHQNEYNRSNPEYKKVIYTYYAEDDYLIDTDDDRPLHNGDIIVGVDNLKFGHGSDDIDVVYVRNDSLELDMQICRLNRSYEEEELGLHRSDEDDDDDDDDA